MRSVWKYAVEPDEFVVEMPTGAVVLSVEAQYGLVSMWALVNPEAPLCSRRFVTVGTGHPLPDEIDSFRFVGTFQMRGGSLVFHLFEVPE